MSYMYREQRMPQVIAAGLELAETVGLSNVTLSALAKKLGIHHPTISQQFKTIDNVKRKIATHALDVGNTKVIFQAVVLNYLDASSLPPEIRKVYSQLN